LRIIACGKAADYENTAKALDDLQATDAELAQYYAELYQHKWDEAATAMWEGLAFVQRGIRSLNSDDEILIFRIY